MKRRSFLGLLGLAPAVAVGAVKVAEAAVAPRKGTNRVILGLTEGKYQFKVSKPGFDVLDPGSELITVGSITAGTIAATSITASKIEASQVSAINANLG